MKSFSLKAMSRRAIKRIVKRSWLPFTFDAIQTVLPMSARFESWLGGFLENEWTTHGHSVIVANKFLQSRFPNPGNINLGFKMSCKPHPFTWDANRYPKVQNRRIIENKWNWFLFGLNLNPIWHLRFLWSLGSLVSIKNQGPCRPVVAGPSSFPGHEWVPPVAASRAPQQLVAVQPLRRKLRRPTAVAPPKCSDHLAKGWYLVTQDSSRIDFSPAKVWQWMDNIQ